jgi:UDP-glucose 4-epimerase
MSYVLVTGGAGFIGSHIVEALLARGDHVAVLDDCSTGNLDNLAAVRSNPRLKVIPGSVCDETAVDRACADADAVVHLAAAVGVQRILERQVESITINVRGTEIVLRAACDHGRIPVFIASSSEVYGKQNNVPFRENDDSVLGATSLHRWSYACGKAMDEFLGLAYHREQALPVVIGRFFNITGPRQSPHYGMVLPRFCRAALAGTALEVHGDGKQSRCFLHVRDCVGAILSLMGCKAAVGQVVNIGGTEEIGMRDLAEAVLREAGTKAEVRSVSYEQAYPQGGFEDLRRRVPDTDKLRKLTGWQPSLPLREIIHDCLKTAAGEAKRSQQS